MASTRNQIRLLRGLSRLELPASLECGVGDDLRRSALHGDVQEIDPSFRALSALRSLSRLEAPEALEQRVRARLEQEWDQAPRLSQSSAAGLAHVVSMSEAQAPGVLDRLVDEELADPAARSAERFVGNLTRLAAPAELEARVIEELLVGDAQPVQGGTSAPRRAWIGLVAAAAAVLLWLFIGPEKEPESPFARPRLRRVYADSFQGLNPLARGLGGALAGGLVASSQGTTTSPLSPLERSDESSEAEALPAEVR